MNNPSIFTRVLKLYKNVGLKMILYIAFRKLIFAYIKILNARRLLKKTKNTKRIIKEIIGSKMYLDSSIDDGLSRYLTIADIREEYMVNIMKNELKEGDIVIDLGANVGYYALLEAKMIGENGKVYAIEPVPETVSLLKENIDLNDYSNIEVFQQAIGDKTGSTKMYVSKWLNRSQMKEIGIKSEIISHEIRVPISTLDEFLKNKPHPSIIRMDVEGYEYNIIKGMKRTLGKNLPLKLFLEFHFRWLQKERCIDILQTLKNTGFEISYATYELDEKCITHSNFLANIAAFLNSKVSNLPLKGQIDINIDEILSNKTIWDGEGALDLCLRFGCLEIVFKKTISEK